MSTVSAIVALVVGIGLLLPGGCSAVVALYANQGVPLLIGVPLLLGGVALIMFAIESLRAPRTQRGFPVLPAQKEKPDVQDSRRGD